AQNTRDSYDGFLTQGDSRPASGQTSPPALVSGVFCCGLRQIHVSCSSSNVDGRIPWEGFSNRPDGLNDCPTYLREGRTMEPINRRKFLANSGAAVACLGAASLAVPASPA